MVLDIDKFGSSIECVILCQVNDSYAITLQLYKLLVHTKIIKHPL